MFENFSSNLGLAFQIKDDLLDIEGNEKEIGKKTRKDSGKGKGTLISLLGKEKARKKSEELIASSLKILKKFFRVNRSLFISITFLPLTEYFCKLFNVQIVIPREDRIGHQAGNIDAILDRCIYLKKIKGINTIFVFCEYRRNVSNLYLRNKLINSLRKIGFICLEFLLLYVAFVVVRLTALTRLVRIDSRFDAFFLHCLPSF